MGCRPSHSGCEGIDRGIAQDQEAEGDFFGCGPISEDALAHRVDVGLQAGIVKYQTFFSTPIDYIGLGEKSLSALVK